MSTITTIAAGDQITDSRTVINTNFSNLNTDKMEASVLDTSTDLDGALASDLKVPSQLAVKTYVDTQGGANASETVRGIVEEATDAEVTAGTATGGTGAKLVITPAKLATRLAALSSGVRTNYTTVATNVGDSTTQFDITNPAGTTFRYTYDGTGTDPSFSAVNYPVGTGVYFNAQNFTAANNGAFVVTGSGSNYIEVTNASGVAENDKTIGTGYVYKGTAWTKPSGLKYITVEVQGAGGGSGGNTSTSDRVNSGGGAGAYSFKRIAAASLAATEAVIVGIGGTGASGSGAGGTGGNSLFGAHVKCTGGGGGSTLSTGINIAGGAGGVATLGDLNINGAAGGLAQTLVAGSMYQAGSGADSVFGWGGAGQIASGATDAVAAAGTGYGSGASGPGQDSNSGVQNGAAGAGGLIVVTEYYV